MKLKDLDVRQFVKSDSSGKKEVLMGIAFLCPCCKREYLTCFFRETPFAEQRELMKNVVTNVDGATWIPSAAFTAYATANEDDLDHITIRPSIDASALGHSLVTVSNGEVHH